VLLATKYPFLLAGTQNQYRRVQKSTDWLTRICSLVITNRKSITSQHVLPYITTVYHEFMMRSLVISSAASLQSSNNDNHGFILPYLYISTRTHTVQPCPSHQVLEKIHPSVLYAPVLFPINRGYTGKQVRLTHFGPHCCGSKLACYCFPPSPTRPRATHTRA
jgi:hypothetical protein